MDEMSMKEERIRMYMKIIKARKNQIVMKFIKCVAIIESIPFELLIERINFKNIAN